MQPSCVWRPRQLLHRWMSDGTEIYLAKGPATPGRVLRVSRDYLEKVWYVMLLDWNHDTGFLSRVIRIASSDIYFSLYLLNCSMYITGLYLGLSAKTKLNSYAVCFWYTYICPNYSRENFWNNIHIVLGVTRFCLYVCPCAWRACLSVCPCTWPCLWLLISITSCIWYG